MNKRVISLAIALSMISNIVAATNIGGNKSRPTNALAMKALGDKNTKENPRTNGLRMWYNKAGIDWQSESLPIGNSHTGVLIFGGVAKERLHFTEKSLWTGGPNSNAADGIGNYDGGNRDSAASAKTISKIQSNLENTSKHVFGEGSHPHANTLGAIWGDVGGMGSFMDFGDLYIDFSPSGHHEDNVSNYERDLNLNTGLASVHYAYNRTKFNRTYFASYPDKVVVYHFTASKKGKQSFNVEIVPHSAIGAKVKITSNNTMTLSGKLNNGLRYQATVKIINKGGRKTVNGNKIEIRNANSVTMIMTTATDYKNEYPKYRRNENPSIQVKKRLSKASAKSYATLKKTHVADHSKLFSRVSLDIGGVLPTIPTDELIAQYRDGDYNRTLDELTFQFGRYLTIAGSRPGTLPLNLQGLWGLAGAHGGMTWNSDFHMNLNFQMNYWPTYITNLEECGLSMVEYAASLVEPGRVTAEKSHGIKNATTKKTGWIVHTQNNPFGMTAPGISQEYGWNMGGAAWLLQNMYDHYRFTGDKTILRNIIYPAMREQAIFWDQYLIESEGQGRLVVSPSVSAEHGPTAKGSTYDQSLVWQLYKETIEAAKILNRDDKLIIAWTKRMNKLKPIFIGEEGQIKEWYEETTFGQAGGARIPNFNAGGADVHRHTSQLIGLYPGNLISHETPDLIEAAKISLEQRQFEIATAWSKAHRLNMWGRTLDGNKTYRTLQSLLTQDSRGMMDNLFSSHGAHTGAVDNAHNIFQIDANYGYTSGLAEMLLQSHLGYIQPLPALPDAWPIGEVNGLVARGNFECDMRWSNNTLSSMKIKSRNGGKCIIVYPNISKASIIDSNNEIVQFARTDKNTISFDTNVNKEYIITNNTNAILETPKSFESYRVNNDSVQMKWDKVPNASEYVVLREKLNVIQSGQSRGETYGEGYEEIAKVKEEEYIDKLIDTNAKTSYMVYAINNSDGVSSPCSPVQVRKIDFASLISDSQQTLLSLTKPSLKLAKNALKNIILKSIKLNDNIENMSLTEILDVYNALEKTNEKCKHLAE